MSSTSESIGSGFGGGGGQKNGWDVKEKVWGKCNKKNGPKYVGCLRREGKYDWLRDFSVQQILISAEKKEKNTISDKGGGLK
jgi:hypothetical protein